MDPIQLIEAKVAELREERRKAELHLGMIDHELQEQEIALRVLRRYLPESGPGVEVSPPAKLSLTGGDVSLEVKPMLVKDMALSILMDAYPRGLTAAEIRHGAQERFKQDINPNTLTVSLGRYKEKNRVTIDGRRWRYVPSEAEKQEAVSELFS